MKRLFMVILLPLLVTNGFGQHQELNEKPGLWKSKEAVDDSSSLLAAFRKGKVSGHFRYNFMATDNAKGLSDYHAHAAGGGIKFESAGFRSFQFGISGFFAFNLGSTNLATADPKTGQPNRYEIGLFDIEDLSNKSNLSRLEELYLKYNFKKTATLTLGKQLINTPFINLQDGRMRPTAVEGLWADINLPFQLKIEAGYLYGISPRSTMRWFKPGESIGLYPQGLATTGRKANYRDNLKSSAIALLGLTYSRGPNWKWQLWNLYADQLFNSLLLQADFQQELSTKDKIYASVQAIRQDAIDKGGNPDPDKTYFEKGGHSQTFGARAGWKNERLDISVNFNRITSAGRYLLPREWGRDPFFTFLPRERNEGLGDVTAWVGKMGYLFPKARIRAQVAAGHFALPDVTNHILNKYGMPSYNQLNLDLRYGFPHPFEGWTAQLLYVYKRKLGNTYNDEKYVINKVNMSLYNLVLNFNF
jgi:hypothetical protein